MKVWQNGGVLRLKWRGNEGGVFGIVVWQGVWFIEKKTLPLQDISIEGYDEESLIVWYGLVNADGL